MAQKVTARGNRFMLLDVEHIRGRAAELDITSDEPKSAIRKAGVAAKVEKGPEGAMGSAPAKNSETEKKEVELKQQDETKDVDATKKELPWIQVQKKKKNCFQPRQIGLPERCTDGSVENELGRQRRSTKMAVKPMGHNWGPQSGNLGAVTKPIQAASAQGRPPKASRDESTSDLMTLDQRKKSEEATRSTPCRHLQKAGEGGDPSQLQAMYLLKKKSADDDHKVPAISKNLRPRHHQKHVRQAAAELLFEIPALQEPLQNTAKVTKPMPPPPDIDNMDIFPELGGTK